MAEGQWQVTALPLKQVKHPPSFPLPFYLFLISLISLLIYLTFKKQKRSNRNRRRRRVKSPKHPFKVKWLGCRFGGEVWSLDENGMIT